jgi:hypothetical protein
MLIGGEDIEPEHNAVQAIEEMVSTTTRKRHFQA